MIKKLRRKFILLSTSAFLAVLAVLITGINLLNWNTVVREADTVLTLLSETNGVFPMGPGGKPGRLPPGMSPERPYEARFFSVILEDGVPVLADTSRIISVDQDMAAQLSREVLEQEQSSGFHGAFRYLVQEEGTLCRVIFLDCGRKLDTFRHFLLISIGISLLGFLVVFLLIAFFSGRILRPISESYEKQKRFITDAGHELKTPLTIIGADAEVLSMELGENEWLEDIRRQAGRLAGLTNDLVLLSRMEEGEQVMPLIEFPFSDVVSEAAASFLAPAQMQKKDFKTDIPPMLSLRGNEKAICQLVNILLDNALKYSPEGGSIQLSVQCGGKQLRLSVFNTTREKVEKEQLSLLFDRFYRADAARDSRTGGYGIGLSVAKAIVTAHGGKIQASAPEENSLLITVIFPV